MIQENLLVGRVSLGVFPHGLRWLPFPTVREYGFEAITVENHRRLWDTGERPEKAELVGL